MRRVFAAFSIVLALIVLAVTLGPRVLPQTTLNSMTAAILEATLGYPVSVAGPSDFALIPGFRLEARGVSARVAARGKDTPALFDIGAVIVEIDTASLLFNRVRIDRIQLERPVIRLHTDPDGDANWRRHEPARTPPQTPELDRDWGWWDQFDIGQIRILDGRLLWVDRPRNWRFEAEKIGLASSKPNNTTSGPGFALAGNALVNGERMALRLETGAISKALAGGRFPVVIDARGTTASVRYNGAAAKRQVFVSEGVVTLDIPDLPRFRQWLGRGAAPPATGGGIGLSARLDISGDRVSVGDINLRWPGGKGIGELSASLRRDRTMVLDGNIHLDTLDMGALGGETMLAAGAAFLPDRLVGKVVIDWQRFQRASLHAGAGRAILKFTTGPERWAVEASSDSFYGGRAQANLRWGMAEGMASLRADFLLSRIDAGKMLNHLTDTAPLAGTADIRFDLFSVGGNANELLAALGGNGRFNIVNGSLRDPGLARYLSDGDKPVTFSQLLGSFKAGQGIVKTEDLLLRTANSSLLGAGEVDLAESYINIDLRSISRQADSASKRPEIKPFRIEGPISAFSTEAK